jgi:hypothetical protein
METDFPYSIILYTGMTLKMADRGLEILGSRHTLHSLREYKTRALEAIVECLHLQDHGRIKLINPQI